jgi:hypothetical protein
MHCINAIPTSKLPKFTCLISNIWVQTSKFSLKTFPMYTMLKIIGYCLCMLSDYTWTTMPTTYIIY